MNTVPMKNKNENKEVRQEITCPACHTSFVVLQQQTINYCVYCKALLRPLSEDETHATLTGTVPEETITIVKGHLPDREEIKFTIGPYQILDSIGKGGMGEVFLAYDTTCGRRIALKRIRPDLLMHKQLHNRFLKEARITSQLTHPAIIPIYAIQSHEELAYYTMPYVEGRTLRQIIAIARRQEKQGTKLHENITSIPALVRIFLSVCQAVAYAHSKGIVHRDLKPNNIIVGQYGEVMILDWGLAQLLSKDEEGEADESEELAQQKVSMEMTRRGKVVGTVAYLAPERGQGQPATFQTEVYSLGVILYQILTLHHPFHRGSLEEFRKMMHKEVLHDPAEIAPYRDVPPALSHIVHKCLSYQPENRYQSVDDLIREIESYLEGRSEWFRAAELDTNKKTDWEFQENILIAEHMAITRGTDVSDWVILMVSNASFTGNTKIEARVHIGEKGHGIGFLLSIPEHSERVHPTSGYCLWISSDLNKSTKLLRESVEVLYSPEIFLQRNTWTNIRIEKIENNIYFYLNNVLQFSYISHLPLRGTHIGVLARDVDFSLQDFHVSVGSQNIIVNCLAVPDAFLAHRHYGIALSEYRRIGYAFPGTAEAREALFRAGITLLEEAKNSPTVKIRLEKADEALEEFSKLRGTPGAPLEYLGKALVYQAIEDYEEEAKCFELAHRRYPSHPLLPVLQEQLIYRMYESSRYNRQAAYNFVLLAIRHLPPALIGHNVKRLFSSLKNNWERLEFFVDGGLDAHAQNLNMAISLSFWLAKPHVIVEIIHELIRSSNLDIKVASNALFALIKLGRLKLAQSKLNGLLKRASYFPNQTDLIPHLELVRVAIQCGNEPLQVVKEYLFKNLPKELGSQEMRVIVHLMEQALRQQQTQLVHRIAERLKKHTYLPETQLRIDCYQIWAFLLEKNWEAAGNLLHEYPLEQLVNETTLLHFLYGCWLYVTEGKDIASIHFASVLDVPYPHSWTLFSHFFNKKESEKLAWIQKAFIWEKRQLFLQSALFYHCKGEEEKAKEFRDLAKKEFLEDSVA